MGAHLHLGNMHAVATSEVIRQNGLSQSYQHPCLVIRVGLA